MSTTPKRRWYQFSLKTLLIAMLLFTVGVAWLGPKMIQLAEEGKFRMDEEERFQRLNKDWHRRHPSEK